MCQNNFHLSIVIQSKRKRVVEDLSEKNSITLIYVPEILRFALDDNII